jgi:transcriptional regulator with XRE-family HTH domain
MISIDAQTQLSNLGKRLRALRLERNERQEDFAARLGVSVPTLRKLEQGDPAVAVGTWLDAIWLLDRLDDLAQVLAPRKSLFDQWERQQLPERKRASRT